MSKLWEKRKPPTPLNWDECLTNHNIPLQQEDQRSNTENNTNDANKLASHKIWSVSECSKVFEDSVNRLYKRLNESGENAESQILCWDKDDEDAMNFVASAANLRCFVFSIIVKSKFEIKCNLF